MRVVPLMNSGEIYSSNVYLLPGDGNHLEDPNTLVGVDSDPAVLGSLKEAPTGVGKSKVEQVVLTHGHYDHSSLLPVIRAMFRPRVMAFAPCVDGVDERLKDGDTLHMGDSTFEVIHAPGHSSDSVCLYAPMEGVLFAGDAPWLIRTAGGSHEPEFGRLLEIVTSHFRSCRPTARPEAAPSKKVREMGS